MIIILLFPIMPSVSLATGEPKNHSYFIHHNLKVRLFPAEKRIIAEDEITIQEGYGHEFRFFLHKGLELVSASSAISIVPDMEDSNHAKNIYRVFSVKLPPDTNRFTMKFSGTIYHPIEQDMEQARGFSDTPGIISDEGVYLSGGAFWYPEFENSRLTFSLQAELPSGWNAVSQGDRIMHIKDKDTTLVRWDSPEPQQEIFLVAARFKEYSENFISTRGNRLSAMVFLRTPDDSLAAMYLEATKKYINMYEDLLGPYPYRKFALVENFFETGFGMPSFTLLGPKVIRLPFIINSSYPHEILHNWFGNSVFPDYEKGNWSEGLTAYLSDHLIKEQQGSGAEYRLNTLQKYANYVIKERDFPLFEFRSRHSPSTEAIGYGKSLMFFHMLRMQLGDGLFINGLREFYHNSKFSLATFEDIKKSFELVSGRDLSREFSQWTKRTGAPELRLSSASVISEKDGFKIRFVIEQIQESEPYSLNIPVAITMKGIDHAYQAVVNMKNKQEEFSITVPVMPLRIDIDPEFDLFRRLNRDEMPPAISQVLGAEKILIIIPSSLPKELFEAYRNLSSIIKKAVQGSTDIVSDKKITILPQDSSVIILGWENNLAKEAMKRLSLHNVSMEDERLTIGKINVKRNRASFVLTARNHENREQAIMFIASDSPNALPGLGRKLPHYHKYSYLVFEGDEPENIAKGRWEITDSPMTFFFPEVKGIIPRPSLGLLLNRSPLAASRSSFSIENMIDTIKTLTSDQFEGRGIGTKGLDRAAEFIADKFKEAGLEPGGDSEKCYFQIWEDTGGDPEQKLLLKNVIGFIPGRRPEFNGQSVVVGAHYDHLGFGWPDVKEGNKGKMHPGADDNASGVAVLLELARSFHKTGADRTIVFVAFSGEEAGRKGSRYYVKNYKRFSMNKITGMINLDTVGRLGKGKLIILGTDTASEWVHILKGAGYATGVEIETPSGRLDASDNISFVEAGIPAIQVSSGPHPDYHRPSDTHDRIDTDGLLKIATIVREAIEYLSMSKEPLTTKVRPEESRELDRKKERKVILGVIPDYSLNIKGVRVSGVVPDSPAEESGLIKGDVITEINSIQIRSLKDLSDALKSLEPGSRVSITLIRDSKEIKIHAELKSR